MICECGLTKAHFACVSCGMHVGATYAPCPSCRYFKFTPVEVEAAQIHPQPELATELVTPKPARREKRRAATQ